MYEEATRCIENVSARAIVQSVCAVCVCVCLCA